MAPARITEPFVSVLSRPRTALRLGICLAMVSLAVTGGMPTTAALHTGAGDGKNRRHRAPGGATRGIHPVRRLPVTPRHPSATPTRASEIANVVVFVKDAPRDGTLTSMRAQMRQQDEGFVPRLVAITRGSTVEFPNSDPFFHNVFSLSRGATFDLGRFPRGESRSRAFTRPGLVKVYCHLHSQMSAAIMVFDHSHFTIPEGNGHFSLADVPAGEYRLSAWHERVGESSKSIVVTAGRTVTIEFALPVDSQ